MAMTERNAKQSDFDWLWKTYQELLKQYIAIQWGWDELWQKENFAKHLPANKFVIVSDKGNDVAAYFVIEEDDYLYLSMILVIKPVQSKGIGTSILSKLKDRSRSLSKPLRLSVFDANPVSDFYIKNGFRIVGRKEGSNVFEYAS